MTDIKSGPGNEPTRVLSCEQPDCDGSCMNRTPPVVDYLVSIGAMCPKCGHGTRVTSKRWARCKQCGERVPRDPFGGAGSAYGRRAVCHRRAFLERRVGEIEDIILVLLGENAHQLVAGFIRYDEAARRIMAARKAAAADALAAYDAARKP